MTIRAPDPPGPKGHISIGLPGLFREKALQRVRVTF